MSDTTERELSLTATDASSGCACCSPSTEVNQEPVASAGQESDTYQVAGMTCGHCESSVKEELLKLPGVTSVAIDLHPGAQSAVTVISDGPVSAETVRAAIAEAGYEVSAS